MRNFLDQDGVLPVILSFNGRHQKISICTIGFYLCLVLTLWQTAAAAPGDLDLTFSGDGKQFDTFSGTTNDIARAVVLQTDGKIISAGYVTNGTTVDFAVIRYNPNGALDSTFGTGGKVVTPVTTADDYANAAAVQADGKIVVAGRAVNGGFNNIIVVRYNTDGSLDPTFSGDGKVVTTVGAVSSAAGLAIQTDGKIVVAGTTQATAGAVNNFAVVRYNANGTLDTTFDGDGSAVTAVGSESDFANAVVIQPDGRIVAAGSSSAGTHKDFAAVRYNPNGSLDPTFSGDGKTTTATSAGDDFANAVTLQPDGKIVAAGYASNTTGDFAVVRYNANGALDTTFSGDGIVTTPVLSSTDLAFAAAVQSNGKIVVAGLAYNGANNDFALVRYNTNGALDTTYGTGGKLTLDFGSTNDSGYGMAIDSSGSELVAGESSGRFAAARIAGDYTPTAAAVSISGRVLTPENRGLANSFVSLTDALGRTQTVSTSAFGAYRFSDVAAGQIVVVSVSSKRYSFVSQIVSVTDNLTGLNLTAQQSPGN